MSASACSSVTGHYLADFRPTEFRADLGAYGVSPLFEGKHPQHPHSLRRTCLTLLTDAGVPDAEVKLIAGHARVGVTRRSYVAMTPAQQRSLYDAVCRLFPSPPKVTKPRRKKSAA